jgi:hypothetical protein
VDVGSVANVSEENAVSIFRGEVCRIGIQWGVFLLLSVWVYKDNRQTTCVIE